MRKVLPVLLLAAVSACAFPETRWVKDGADDRTTSNDLNTCRRAAQQETFEAAPFFGYGFGPPFSHYRHPWGWGYFGGGDRLYTQNRLTDFCMRNKGYTLITLAPPQTKAPASTPQPSPAASADK